MTICSSLGPARDVRPGLDLRRVSAERERPFERPCGSTSPQSATNSLFSSLGFVLALAVIWRLALAGIRRLVVQIKAVQTMICSFLGPARDVGPGLDLRRGSAERGRAFGRLWSTSSQSAIKLPYIYIYQNIYTSLYIYIYICRFQEKAKQGACTSRVFTFMIQGVG